MSNEILQEYLGLRAPKPYSKTKTLLGVDPNLLYGVELEIEGLVNDRHSYCVAGVQDHEDGSLRNNGGEFVTLPMNYANLEIVLNEFFGKNQFTKDNYSERCSVHVHANCQDLTLNQIRLIVSVYQVLEKVLFNFIKDGRDENIFCVPISETIIGSQIMSSATELIQTANRKWRKYTALNLIPLYSLGTLEFRHMAGTNDVNRILQWCDIIGSLFKYARENQFDDVIKYIKGLNTSSAYGTFMQTIFPGYLYDILAIGNFREYLEEGVINMKCMLMNKPKNFKYVPEPRPDGWRIEFNDLVEEDVPRAEDAPLRAMAQQVAAQAVPQDQEVRIHDPRLPLENPGLTAHEQRRLDETNTAYLRMFNRIMTPRETAAFLAQVRAQAAAAQPVPGALARDVRRRNQI